MCMSEKYYTELMDVFETIDTRQAVAGSVFTVIYEDEACGKCGHLVDEGALVGDRTHCFTCVSVEDLVATHGA